MGTSAHAEPCTKPPSAAHFRAMRRFEAQRASGLPSWPGTDAVALCAVAQGQATDQRLFSESRISRSSTVSSGGGAGGSALRMRFIIFTI